MWRHIVSAALLLWVSDAWTYGDGSTKKTVHDLRAEVKKLRALEKAEVNEIAARYDSLLAKLRNPEHNLEEIRAQLRAEEKTALQNVKSADEKKQIRAQYQELIKNLSGKIKADKEVIKVIAEQKRAVEKQVRVGYAAKIKELENEIKSLEKKGARKSKG